MPRTEIERLIGQRDERQLVLYGPVSGHGQAADRATQLERLQTWSEADRKGVETVILSDSGSGLNADRRHLQRLLKLVCEDNVSEIAVTDEDRLTRFGQAYLEIVFSCVGVKLTVREPGDEKTPEQELATDLGYPDLLALIASFSGRHYGVRSHTKQELVTCAKEVINRP
ncbi:MAG: IS607 family transposase [Ktedonobacterales bacterium]